MDKPFDFADELGPLKVIEIYVPKPKLKGILVVDNVSAGPSIGGLRMAPDVSRAECFRLARAMSMKNAAAGLPHGGGKSVIFADPRQPREQKEQLIRCFAAALKNEEDYIFGPDMGTDEICMSWIRDEIGGRAVGLPIELGGIPLDEIGATGFGLAVAVEVAVNYCKLKLKGARVVVQGFGSVGKHAARFLTERGGVLVGVADSRGSSVNPDGLNVEALIAHKKEGLSVIDFPGGRGGNGDELIDLECEIWIPAARPDVISESNVDRLKTKLIVSGANIPITSGAEKILHERKVLMVPDFIANAGGVICAAVEYHGGNRASAFQMIEERIRFNTRAVLERVKGEGVEPRRAAIELATERLRAAMESRRWTLF